MNPYLLVALSVLVAAVVLLQVFLIFRKSRIDLSPMEQMAQSMDKSHARTEQLVRDEIAANRQEVSEALRQSREEVGATLKGMGDSLVQQLAVLMQTNDRKLTEIRHTMDTSLGIFRESTTKAMTDLTISQKSHLDAFSIQLSRLTESNEQKIEALKGAVEGKLREMQQDNARQLDQMRATVDEKLQGTLEKRLGESFKQVSERLEQVYKGLGEMQILATGVGDLKKVLTNVKTRGTWGEVQLWAMLEQVLTPEQYAQNVATKESGQRVEFAVKLPGKDDDKDETVWLPIDAKFPVEDYQRLLEAQDRGDGEMAESAAKQLENRIKQCASDICEKYINPPRTTDFGILFLPIEGLFAEVIRRPGLTEYVQSKCKVVVAGPTTLWSILNSLQMGFRTLAIQRRSSEVWTLLAAVKTEWTKYGEVLSRVHRKLHEASDTIEEAQTRTRAIGRKLRTVQELPTGEAQTVLRLESSDANTEDAGSV